MPEDTQSSIAHLRSLSQQQRQEQEGKEFTPAPLLKDQVSSQTAEQYTEQPVTPRKFKNARKPGTLKYEKFVFLTPIDPDELTTYPKQTVSTRLRSIQDASTDVFLAQCKMYFGRPVSKEVYHEILNMLLQNNTSIQEMFLEEVERRMALYNNNL